MKSSVSFGCMEFSSSSTTKTLREFLSRNWKRIGSRFMKRCVPSDSSCKGSVKEECCSGAGPSSLSCTVTRRRAVGSPSSVRERIV